MRQMLASSVAHNIERTVITSPPFMEPASMRTLPYHSASAYAENAMKNTNPMRAPLENAACVPTCSRRHVRP